MKKNIFKISAFYLILSLLLSFLIFLYNQRRDGVFAQEIPAEGTQETQQIQQEAEIKCEAEMPIGETIDKTQDLIKKIIDAATIIVQSSEEAANSGEELIKLVDQCKAENCQSGCKEWCEGLKNCGETNTPCVPSCHGNPPVCDSVPTQKQCGRDQKGNPVYCTVYYLYCKDYIPKCEISGCNGDPCPSEQITSEIQKIEDDYKKIKLVYEGGKVNDEEIEGLKDLVKKPDKIFPLLGDTRNKLRICIIPSEDYEKSVEGEIRAQLFFSCENAKEIDKTLSDCYPNNYFCCE